MASQTTTTAAKRSSYQNLKTEPAFISNEKYLRSRPISQTHKSLNDCCYSLANIVLIVASILALVFLVKFFQDEVLQEYIEHLFSLRFYRQLVYTTIIIPLVLIIPLFNAASACFLSGRSKRELGRPLVRIVLIAILVFISLIFMAPNTRFATLAPQLELELHRHMRMRYEETFSFTLIERIQYEYKCCDELWYRSNYIDKVPFSCYLDNAYSRIFPQTCSNVLADLISDWCCFIAVGLLVILIALATLLSLDIIDLLAISNYNVERRESQLGRAGSLSRSSSQTSSLDGGGGGGRQAVSNGLLGPKSAKSSGQRSPDEQVSDESACEDNVMVGDIGNKLQLGQRDHQQTSAKRLIPISRGDFRAGIGTGSRAASNGRPSTSKVRHGDADDDCETGLMGTLAPDRAEPSPILTRANYVTSRLRPQSPVFLTHSTPSSSLLRSGRSNDDDEDEDDADTDGDNNGTGTTQSQQTYKKSSLKKTSSIQRITNIDDDDDDGDDDGKGDAHRRDGEHRFETSFHEHQKELHRELQTRRSLLSVRFAD